MRLSHPFKTVFVLIAGLLLASTVSGANLPLEVKNRLGEFFSDSGVTLARSPAKSLNALENFLNYGPAASECCNGPENNLASKTDGNLRGNGRGNNGSFEAEADFGNLPPLRQKYVKDVNDLQAEVDAMRATGRSSEEIARYASSRRNEIKKPILEATPPELLEKIKQRNLERYQNESGPTVDQLRAQGKSWEEIIDGATRAGGEDLF